VSGAGELTLLPNLGGEEGDRWRRMASEPSVRNAAALWGSLFGATALCEGTPASPFEEPAFDWLPTHGSVAWWGDARAAAELPAGAELWPGAAPERVESVHDKAFALHEGAAPPELRGVARAYDPEELRSPDEAVQALRECLNAWPVALRRRFCLKPRLGSSGRGRVLGEEGEPDTPVIRGALARLAERGGAILEPWLERTIDLSVSFHVRPAASGPPLELLGSLTSLQRTAGVPLGHRGEIDSRGRVYSGSAFDDRVREAASELALAALEAGYHGPCGVDSFAYRDADGREVLRPIVEFNARFTMGLVALGCLRRARAALRERLGVEPGTRAGVLMLFETPSLDWQAAGVDVVLPVETTAPTHSGGPAILGCREPASLDDVIPHLLDATAATPSS